MVKKSAKNNELLKSSRDRTSPQVYALLIELVNEDREDLAEMVLKIDYLLEYANICVKQKDFKEGKESFGKAKTRIIKLKEEGVNTEFLDFLCEGIEKKLRK